MKKIISFGDSFVFGNEIQDNLDGSGAWPGLVAQDLECSYQTLAVPGCGNENIARQIYTYFSNNSPDDTLAIINWTWCMRWDFFLASSDCWITLGPTCVPGKLEHLIGKQKATELVDFYKAHAEQSHIWNVFRSVQTVYAVQCWLKQHGIKSVQTYMDLSLIENTPLNRLEHYAAYKDPSWPSVFTEQELSNLPAVIIDEVNKNFYEQTVPDYVTGLQQLIKPDLETFEGKTFLDWSYHKQFAVTDLLHPLEQAHRAAANLWQDRYRQMLYGHMT
jgi:hypothetical protein